MSISRASLVRGPAFVTLGGANFFTRDDIVARHAPVYETVATSQHGAIDKFKRDFVIKVPLTIFGLWENLPILFPAALLNPEPGKSILGADAPMVIHARNGDRITYHNAAITKLVDLYCGVDSEVFAAALEVTCLMVNGGNPEEEAAYFTRDNLAIAALPALDRTKFKKARWSGVWAAQTGFEAFVSEKGFHVSWQLDIKSEAPDGHGTIDLYIGEGGLIAGVKCIPIGPTPAEIDAFQLGTAHGSLLSGGAADLTLSGGGASVVLKGAALTESGTAFGIDPLRVGEVAWETTRAVTAGALGAVATVA